ncbi:MAG: hypothetical protein J0G95_13200 [Rhizobiales bacterium]|nr:hypothetical protein [Hyphomicrobiales bacterium]
MTNVGTGGRLRDTDEKSRRQRRKDRIKGDMRNVLFIILALGFAIQSAPIAVMADQVRPDPISKSGVAANGGTASHTARSKASSDRAVPRPAAGNPCAQFGAGFVVAPGSDTCVRIGGGIDIGVGGSR